MYCRYCGEKLEEGATFCTACGKENEVAVEPKKKIKLNASPLSAVSLALSVLSFLFGFVLLTCMLATKKYSMVAENIALLPALAAFSIGIHEACAHKEKHTRVISIISISVSLFVLLYTFITYAVFVG